MQIELHCVCLGDQFDIVYMCSDVELVGQLIESLTLLQVIS